METLRSSGREEDGRAPQRGRPRLEARSQTQGERRRTQIRLAQRAYRQRKETTITELNHRVADLERTISEMNQIVAGFRETATASGLHEIEPRLAQSLQAVTLRFNDIASRTAPSQAKRALAQGPNLSARTYGAAETQDIIVAANATESGTDENAPRERRTERPIASPWGYVFGTEQGQDGKGGESYDTNTSSAPHDDENKPLSDNLSASDESCSLVLLSTKRMASPVTYSFRESTFARRLLRAAYERAYRVLMDPIRNGKTIQEMCRYTFCFNNFENIRRWVADAVARTDRESLELWPVTSPHLGGAGLHYPRTSLDADGGATPSVCADKALTLPRRSLTPQTPLPDWMTVDQIIKHTGFQGEWFDPNDVEHYLKSKGVIVDANSSWADFDVTMVSTLDATPLAGPEVERPKNSELPITDRTLLHDVNDLVADASTDVDSSMQFENWSANPVAFNQDLLFGDNYSIAGAASKKMLDVECFIRTIIEQAFCLGRTPGWRKEAIDSAIAASMREAV